jgi:mRNA interferase MazF
MCKRGEIYYVDFGNNIGTFKQSGVRPALVVSNNKANTHSPVVTVVPVTTKTRKHHLPTHVLIPTTAGVGLDRMSMALAEQVETLDKTRLMDYKGTVTSKKVMGQITTALQVQIGAFEEYN